MKPSLRLLAFSALLPSLHSKSTPSDVPKALSPHLKRASVESNVQPAVYPFTDFVPFKNINIASGTNLAFYDTTLGCNTHCMQTASCVAYVYYAGNCYLKSTDSNIITSTDTISYFKVRPQRVYSVFNGINFDMPSIAFYNGNHNECRQACDALTGCVGYVI